MGEARPEIDNQILRERETTGLLNRKSTQKGKPDLVGPNGVTRRKTPDN